MSKTFSDQVPNTDIQLYGSTYTAIEEDITLLNEHEKKRMHRFKFDHLKIKFARRITWVKNQLGNHLDVSPKDIHFEYGQHGKPALPQIQFNYSHSKDWILLAIHHEWSLGCDIEWMDPQINVLELSDQFFSPSEANALHRYPKDQQRNVFYNLWSRKEAFIKCSGEGLSYGLDQFSIEEGDVTHPKIYKAKSGIEDWGMYVPKWLENYRVAVCWRE